MSRRYEKKKKGGIQPSLFRSGSTQVSTEMEEQRYHCALCGLQSLRSAAARERFFSQRHRTVRCVRGVRVWPVSCKMSYECLRWYRCMRRALLDALKHLKKSISTTSTYETTRTASSRTCTTARSPSSDQDIKTSNFSPAAGLGPSRRPGRLKKCVLCEDGPIPEAGGTSQLPVQSERRFQ